MAVQWFNPYYVFGGEGGSGTGKVFTKTENGLVPAPGASAGDNLVLRSDGTWGQGSGGSATVGLGKQAKEAMWPAEYAKISQTQLPPIGQWDFKDPEDFYKEIQGLPGYGAQTPTSGIYLNQNVSYMQEYLRSDDVKAAIIKFIKYYNDLGWPLLACWNGVRDDSADSTLYIFTFNTAGQYPCTYIFGYNTPAARTLTDSESSASSSGVGFEYRKSAIPESEGITLPSVSENGEPSNVKITESCIKLHARPTGIEVNKRDSNGNIDTDYASFALDVQFPAPRPGTNETLPYTPNYVLGCLSANVSGYNNYGTLSSIKYDAGNLTFINTQGVVVISVPGATATGEAELTLDDLQKIVYNEESSPKKLEIYDKTGTLRFTVNDASSGT